MAAATELDARRRRLRAALAAILVTALAGCATPSTLLSGECRMRTALAMTWLKLIALALLVSLSSIASGDDDVFGWQGTRWGMTEEEALKVLGGDVMRVDPPARYKNAYAPLRVPVQISTFRLTADLQFSNETRRLVQVLLSAETGDLRLWAQTARSSDREVRSASADR
jgi:hypothetical protein